MSKNKFLNLLHNELWNTPLAFNEISIEEYKAITEYASMQTVNSLVCASLIKNNIKIPQQGGLRAFALLEAVKKANLLLNSNVLMLTELLEKHNIRFFIVKGQTLASLYPNPLYRTPGDIDFYCYPEDFERARLILTDELKVNIEYDDEEEQHLKFEYNKVEFEFHFTLFKFADKENQIYFDGLLNSEKLSSAMIDGKAIPTLNPTLNLAFTFLHLYHHLIELGVGLRQFCDVAVLCHRNYLAEADGDENNKIDIDFLISILRKLDFLKAFTAIGAVLVDELGLPENEFPVAITEKDRKYAQYILKVVYKRGNFGKYGRTTKVRSGLAYYIEQTCIKLSHYYHLFNLSRKENIAVITKDIPKKIKAAIKR